MIVLLGIIFFLFLNLFNMHQLSVIVAWGVTLLGSFKLLTETLTALLKRQFALDYIAILAIAMSLITGQYLVALILALMVVSGRNLEDYATNQAKKALTSLVERIPDKITLWNKDRPGEEIKLKEVKVGQEIFIKKGEVVALDGLLLSPGAILDESSLTGEAQFVDKTSGDQIFSGTINMGKPIALKVTKSEENSTYNKIIGLVKSAQEEKSPLVRLADKYSTYFTIITLIIAAVSFFLSNFDLMRALSVLAIATPCPLIIAAPIALLGGVNAAARERIIIKRLASLESLSKVDVLLFDKTGTITIGKPRLSQVKLLSTLSKNKALGIAESIERSSLHPLAKAIVDFAKLEKAPVEHAKNIEETTGLGISGEVAGRRYLLSKRQKQGMAIELSFKGKPLAVFEFEDEIKEDSKQVISFFKKLGMQLLILTGDKKEAAQQLVKILDQDVSIKAELKPEDKLAEVKRLKLEGKVVAMVGDGINDAPALAASDVGMVFSNEEQTAASEAADVVFLGGQFSSIPISYKIATQTIKIATQSILGGIGVSILGMVLASVGYIPPIIGAGLQEVIDVAVIINAIRASRINS